MTLLIYTLIFTKLQLMVSEFFHDSYMGTFCFQASLDYITERELYIIQ